MKRRATRLKSRRAHFECTGTPANTRPGLGSPTSPGPAQRSANCIQPLGPNAKSASWPRSGQQAKIDRSFSWPNLASQPTCQPASQQASTHTHAVSQSQPAQSASAASRILPLSTPTPSSALRHSPPSHVPDHSCVSHPFFSITFFPAPGLLHLLPAFINSGQLYEPHQSAFCPALSRPPFSHRQARSPSPDGWLTGEDIQARSSSLHLSVQATMKATISRTATFAWSPASLQSDHPYIATGTVAGALDESFSNESVLELWQPGYSSSAAGTESKPLGSVATSARYVVSLYFQLHRSNRRSPLTNTVFSFCPSVSTG